MNISQQIMTFIILVLLVILGGWALLHYPKNSGGPAVDVSATSTTVSLPLATTTSGAVITESAPGVAQTIRMNYPKADDFIESPMTVSGEAKGTWFFEANAGVQLVDTDGNQLAISNLTAQSDWMTTDFVPFTGTLTFAKPGYGTRGFLIISNDNPSGLPENSKSIKIPVRFK